MCQRKTFAGMQHVDLDLSHSALHTFAADEAGALRSTRNGTFYTKDALRHAGFSPNTDCPFCQAPDSLDHRLWHCPEFLKWRCLLPGDVAQFVASSPDCLRLRGWMPFFASCHEFQAILDTIPDTTKQFDIHQWPDGDLHFFTDGSCKCSTLPACRLATWAVCVADLDNDVCAVVARGGVPGGLQTALRAEITSAIAAFECGLARAQQFYLWTDNQLVHNRIQQWTSTGHFSLKRTQKDFDLWARLFGLCRLSVCRGLFANVVKVRSHEDSAACPEAVEKWAIRNNAEADEAADDIHACLTPVVCVTWKRWCQDHSFGLRVVRILRRYFVDVGMRAISLTKQIRRQGDEQWTHTLEQPRQRQLKSCHFPMFQMQ